MPLAAARRVPLGFVIPILSLLACATPSSQVAEPGPAAEATGADRYRDLASVRAFAELQTSIDEMAEVILSDAKTEREATEGMRFLLRTLAMATDVAADGNPKAPHFVRMDTKIRKVGGDNPDAEYDNLSLDNRWDYVIRGDVGSVRHLSFTVTHRSDLGRSKRIGYFNERTLGADEEGRFTLFLSKQQPGPEHGDGLWVDTSEGISGLLVRQYIGDRSRETLASYEIEVLGRAPGDDIPYSTDAEIARALAGTRYAFTSLSTLHRLVMPELLDNPNRFVRANSDDFGADISGSDNLYMIGSFQVDEDEVLIIETDPLDVRYWNLAVESRWHETVDYLTRRTHRTLDDVEVDPDGKLRFVLAHGKTDHPNWLDTGGHREGFLTFRWVGERDSEATLPTILRYKREDLEWALSERRAGL